MDALQKLGIDGWSLVLYLANYGILFFVLGRFVYKPLMKTVDERTGQIRENLNEAERIKQEFQSEIDKRKKQNDEALKQFQLELAQTRNEAESRAKDLIAEAESKREALISQAYADVAAMKERVVREAEQELLARIERIALAAMRSESVSKTALAESVDRAWNELKGV